MSKNRAADGPSLAQTLLFALLLAFCLSIVSWNDEKVFRSAERKVCPERFVPQGHLISEGVGHYTPIKYFSY